MSVNIDNFKSVVKGIQRSTLFEVIVTGAPVIGAFATDNLRFTCKAASVPGSNFGVIEVPYMGRKVKFAGDRTYEEWQTTVIVDNDWEVYKTIYDWHAKMNHPQDNIAVTENMNNNKGTAIIRMLSVTGKSNFAMKLVGFFPHNLQQMDVAWDNNDATADLSVSWSYDYAVRID